eukprot:5859649-Ditylum_brightwellii.AAC.1
MCDAYEACEILSGNPETHPEAVASQVQLSCTTTNMKTGAGVRQCQEACNPGLCCVGGADGKGCNLLHHADDDGFKHDKIAKDAVDKACGDFSAAGIEA